MIKAVREAKVHSSWLTTNPAYEEGLMRFVDRVLGPPGTKFLAAFLPFQKRVALLAVTNSLAQVVLKVGSPGVPDFYQGSELWDLSLVDPDNRRPVDFGLRERMLAELDAQTAPDYPGMLAHWQDARIKLLVTAAALRARRELAPVFAGGAYEPLSTELSVPAGLVAFSRSDGNQTVVIATPRLTAALCTADRPFPLGGEAWKISRILLPRELGHNTFHSIFTGEELKPTIAGDTAFLFAGEVFATLPVAMLRTI
jgi:(1->4)-alpha-D-glucan 1-alpha-D-glucosylmutase